MFRRERRAGGDSYAAAHDRIRAEVAGRRIGNVHRSAFATAITSFLTEQLGEHSVGSSALGQAVSVAAVRTGDVVVDAERFADAHGHGFFAAIEVGQSRHESPRVEFVHLLFKQANAHQLAVDAQPFVFLRLHRRFAASRRLGGCSRHFFFPPAVTGVDTPDMAASTSNMQAKSYFAKPMPRAAVRTSLLTAVVGSGTSNWRPSSNASSISFCIMFTSNQASSGCCRTNGPRYWIMGDATALCVSTSTAVSRAIPLFSASNTPSEKACICTARLRLTAIFMASARPLSPTCVTFGPMSSSSGFTFSKVSLRPPTITDSLPSCSVITLPETGASTMSAPFARTFSASPRLTAGLT